MMLLKTYFGNSQKFYSSGFQKPDIIACHSLFQFKFGQNTDFIIKKQYKYDLAASKFHNVIFVTFYIKELQVSTIPNKVLLNKSFVFNSYYEFRLQFLFLNTFPPRQHRRSCRHTFYHLFSSAEIFLLFYFKNLQM